MSADFLKYLPDQWVGIVALLSFGLYMALQIIEKYPTIAKILPFGVWWHDRQQKKNPRLNEALEDNEIIIALRKQVSTVVEDSAVQALEIASLLQTVRVFRAWSEYDARYHHRVSVENASNAACQLPPHYDFFAFEALWRENPTAAAQL